MNEPQESIRESMLSILQEESGSAVSEDVETSSAADTQEDVDDAVDSGEETVSGDEGSGEQTTDAPEHWSDEDKAVFAQLDDASREILLNMEKNMQSGFTQKTEELAQQRKRYKGFDDLVDAYHANAGGIDRDTFVDGLVQTLPAVMSGYAALNRDPLNTLLQLAKTYGVEEKLSDSLAGIDFSDPNYDLQNRLEKLEAENRQLRSGNGKAEANQGARLIQEFAEAKTDDGVLKHPYFSEVRAVMGGLIAANPSLSLDDAYQEAVWSSPRRKDLLAEQRKQWEREQEAAKAKKIGAARRNASQRATTGKAKAGSAPDDKVPESIADGLRQTWRELTEE